MRIRGPKIIELTLTIFINLAEREHTSLTTYDSRNLAISLVANRLEQDAVQTDKQTCCLGAPCINAGLSTLKRAKNAANAIRTSLLHIPAVPCEPHGRRHGLRCIRHQAISELKPRPGPGAWMDDCPLAQVARCACANTDYRERFQKIDGNVVTLIPASRKQHIPRRWELWAWRRCKRLKCEDRFYIARWGRTDRPRSGDRPCIMSFLLRSMHTGPPSNSNCDESTIHLRLVETLVTVLVLLPNERPPAFCGLTQP